MINRYYQIIHKYFLLNAYNKKMLIYLFLTGFFRSISLLTLPFFASRIVEFLTSGNYTKAIIEVLVFLFVSIIYVFFHHLNFILYGKNSLYTHNELQRLFMKKVTTYDSDFAKKMKSSFIINTAFKDTSEVMKVPDLLFDSINYIISIIISLIILCSVNFYMGIISFILVIIYFIYLNYNLEKRDYYLNGQRRYQDNISELMGQVIDGNKEIKSFNMKGDLEKYLSHYKKFWKKNYFFKRKYDDRADVISPIILGIGKIIIYMIAIYLILNRNYGISMLVLVIGYFEDIEGKIELLYKKLEILSSTSVIIDRVSKILNYHTRNMLSFGDYMEDNIAGKLSFKKVYFTYEKKQVLRNISFQIKPNSFTAIVGKSGSGKSTIFRLILRMYKVNKGHILLDDVDINEYHKDIYGSNVSIVTQKPFVFDMSIRENLNLVDSNYKNQIEACKRVGIHEDIMKLKNGYNTRLESDGQNISSGQKQLLALARVLLSKSEVLLFDEVTSTLDINTSNKILEILKSLKKDHTILMITHKPELMKMADEILVIDNGRLVGRGKHQELMKKNNIYKLLQQK